MSACWSEASFRKRTSRKLIDLGVARVFGPGTAIEAIAELIRGQDVRGHEQLVAPFLQGDRRALSRLLTQAAQSECSKTIRAAARAERQKRGHGHRQSASPAASDRRHGQRRRGKEHADWQAD